LIRTIKVKNHHGKTRKNIAYPNNPRLSVNFRGQSFF
jgi:hypothetical protein